MIQRLQTLFLLGATATTALLIFLPMLHLNLESVNEVDLDEYAGLKVEAEVTSHGAFAEVSLPEGTASGNEVEELNKLIPNKEIPVYLLYAVLAGISFLSIFLFRKMGLQQKLVGFNVFLHLVGVIGVVLVANFAPEMINERVATEIHNRVPDVPMDQVEGSLDISSTYGTAFYCAIGSVVLLLMAWSFIRKDRKLLKSVDRIR